MLTEEPAFRFWLRYAEREGALAEPRGDHALLVLPRAMQEHLGLPESIAATTDPEVARDEGALLLIPGHPVMDAAAGHVLEQGDAGTIWLDWPAKVPPTTEALLAQARDRIGVDHGRLDQVGAAVPRYAPVLRVGVQVTYTVHDPVHEREEVWVDARTGLPVRMELGRRLSEAHRLEGRPQHLAAEPDLARAVAAAHAGLEARVRLRLRQLARLAEAATADELALAESYYTGQLESIARRRETAPVERQRLLDAQDEVTRAERSRRLAAIREAAAPRFAIRPIRLHLLFVPALQLEVAVRRGDRRFPLALTWWLTPAEFSPLRCPACGSGSPLVAARDRLGCRTCVEPRTQPAAAVGQEAAPAEPAAPGTADPPPAQPVPPPATEPRRTDAIRRPASAAAPAPPPAADPATQLTLALGAVAAPPPPGPPPPGARPPARRAPAPTGRRLPPTPERGPHHPETRADRADRAPAAVRQVMDHLRQLHEAEVRQERASRVGHKLAGDFWAAVSRGDPAPRKRSDPGSPLRVLYRLYGGGGPLIGVGLPVGILPSEGGFVTLEAEPGYLQCTTGELLAGGVVYPFSLRWHLAAGRPAIDEVLPFEGAEDARLPRPDLGPRVAPQLFAGAPPPRIPLDPVADRLWQVELPRFGLPLVVRCLAAWGRLGGVAALPDQPAPVVAAALAALVARRAGLGRTRDAAAADHGADPAAVRAAAGALRDSLQLTDERGW